jgi:DNA-binding response OmpR family regulator
MGAKILIVENDEDIHDQYRRWIEEEYEVIQANNGEEAVDMYKVFKPDITLMDMMIPRLPADEAINQIFSHDPDAFIIAISEKSNDQEEIDDAVPLEESHKDYFMGVINSGLKGDRKSGLFFIDMGGATSCSKKRS